MATTTVSDAVVFPQSSGTGLANNADQADAILFSALAQYQGGEYVNTRLLSGIPFSNHDGASDTVDVGPGVCYVRDDSSSTSNDRDGSGNPQGESSTSSGFDFSFADHHYVVVLPTAVTISVSNGTLNEVHIDVDPTSNNSVTIEHDGSSTASPGATALKIGETNPDDATADTRANDDPALRARLLNTGQIGSEHRYAGGCDGADADARLDNALNDANPDDTIYLESADYTDDRTISTVHQFVGTSVEANGARISGTWTISAGGTAMDHIRLNGSGVLDVDSDNVQYRNSIMNGNGDVILGGDQNAVLNVAFANVTFESGTSNGLVDGCANASVTDNGSNTVGDL